MDDDHGHPAPINRREQIKNTANTDLRRSKDDDEGHGDDWLLITEDDGNHP